MISFLYLTENGLPPTVEPSFLWRIGVLTSTNEFLQASAFLSVMDAIAVSGVKLVYFVKILFICLFFNILF